MFELLAVSPPGVYPDEAEWIRRLLDAGLTRCHLRKPAASATELQDFILSIPAEFRARLSIHQHYLLAETCGLSAVHIKDVGSEAEAIAASLAPSLFKSHSLHSIENLDTARSQWDAIFLSPVFPSISKPGHRPAWTEPALRKALAVKEGAGKVFALGGIDAFTVRYSREFGFDGAVLHGALWQSNDPLARFFEIQEALK